MKNLMKNKINLLLLLMAMLLPASAFGNDVIAAADSAYTSKEYDRAITLYRAAMDSMGYSAPLLFNLGNAYYQNSDYGRAMVCYLHARRLDPRNSEINVNINYLRSRVEDANKAEQKGKRLKVTVDEPSFFQSVHSAVAKDVSSNVWAVWGAVCFVLFVGCTALYIFTRGVMLRKVGFFGGMILLLLSIVFEMFAFMGARAFNSRGDGVVTAFKTTLLTEPGKDAENERGGVLTKGTEVKIVSEETDAEGNVTWYKVRLNSDYIGWLKADQIEIVE